MENFQEQKYKGISNPSGAVALNANQFIVADDEDNLLRIYDRNLPENPIQTIALSKVFKGIIEDGEEMEIDIESAAEIAGTFFWLGSHSTSKKGKNRPARQRLLAVTIDGEKNDELKFAPVGEIYTRLIDDLERDGRFAVYQLGKAGEIQPKAIGGLSIEGLAATSGRSLLIGFRNPLVGGKIQDDLLVSAKALLVELRNPFAVIQGDDAEFSDPIELDLGGFGIREITLRKGHDYLIVAGPYHGNEATENYKPELFRLYQWSSNSGEITLIATPGLEGFNVEAAIFYPGNASQVQLLSDDGKLENANNCFRSRFITL